MKKGKYFIKLVEADSETVYPYLGISEERVAELLDLGRSCVNMSKTTDQIKLFSEFCETNAEFGYMCFHLGTVLARSQGEPDIMDMLGDMGIK